MYIIADAAIEGQWKGNAKEKERMRMKAGGGRMVKKGM